MLRANRPVLAYFDSIKALRVRQLALILEAGYDPNLMLNGRGQNGLQFMINYFGATEAHYRLQAPINKSAYLNIAKLLLDSGLDPNAMDLVNDETVLFDAIRYNEKEMVALLLNYVDLALRNKNGETALMCAAHFGSKQVTRLILEHLRHLEMDGYFLRQRNRFGLTALEIARSENLEAAKVLTKHLIAFGHHTGTVLARSVSHHQLNAGVVAPGVVRHRRHNAAAAAAAADLLVADPDCLSPSDYDSDFLAPANVASTVIGRPKRRLPMGPTAAALTPLGYPYYDPKAAQFSQYLLDQQLAMDSGDLGVYGRAGPRGSVAQAAAGRNLSEEEDYMGAPGGQLVRSRSCMLGPSASGACTSKKAADQTGTKMATSWQDQAGSGASANQ